VSGTPTFFVNGRRLTGARSVEQFQEAIDAEMKAGS
jgi:protein-disulfide isomerase